MGARGEERGGYRTEGAWSPPRQLRCHFEGSESRTRGHGHMTSTLRAVFTRADDTPHGLREWDSGKGGWEGVQNPEILGTLPDVT